MLKKIKVLSDFDGVWTDQGPEASHVRGWVVDRCSEFLGIAREQAEREIEGFIAVMNEEPHLYGWAPDGRISAFFDEDPLCEVSSLCGFFELPRDERVAAYRRAIAAAGFANMADFAEHCFRGATSEYLASEAQCMVAGAGEILRALADCGAEVVVVSNSSADKLQKWFGKAGIDAAETGDRQLRLRGAAAKWKLGNSDAVLEVGDRAIFVDRPHYKRAIVEERPDIIIGDVFSLDLALPHVMRTDAVPEAPSTLVLRRHAHTPDWVTVDRGRGAIDHIVAGLDELPAIVRALGDR
jgi:hypothetical protein